MIETVLSREEAHIEEVCAEAYRMLVQDIMDRLAIMNALCVEEEVVYDTADRELCEDGKETDSGGYQCARG